MKSPKSKSEFGFDLTAAAVAVVVLLMVVVTVVVTVVVAAVAAVVRQSERVVHRMRITFHHDGV